MVIKGDQFFIRILTVRAVIILLAREIEGLSIEEAAQKLKRNPACLSRLANNLNEKCNNSPLLKEKFISLKNELLKNTSSK